MRIKELIAELQACNPEAEIRWYHLEDYILTGMELETIITDAWDDRPTVEITVKPEGSERGGVQFYEVENLWKPQPFN